MWSVKNEGYDMVSRSSPPRRQNNNKKKTRKREFARGRNVQ